jgi:hypothetical protein
MPIYIYKCDLSMINVGIGFTKIGIKGQNEETKFMLGISTTPIPMEIKGNNSTNEE